jgi:transcriptional regulator GlxA family with amidase domain
VTKLNAQEIGFSRRQLLAAATAIPTAAALAGARAHAASCAAKNAEPIPVAVLIDEDSSLIDFAGPWRVFTSASARKAPGFRLYLVSNDTMPKLVGEGVPVIPQFALDNAPSPRILVMGAQRGRSERKLEWIRRTHRRADVTMSVCTGSYLLAATGLLDGRTATTHHRFYDDFQSYYPKVKVVRDVQFVDHGDVATTRGLAGSTIFVLKLVERYYGHEAARQTADYIEFT